MLFTQRKSALMVRLSITLQKWTCSRISTLRCASIVSRSLRELKSYSKKRMQGRRHRAVSCLPNRCQPSRATSNSSCQQAIQEARWQKAGKISSNKWRIEIKPCEAPEMLTIKVHPTLTTMSRTSSSKTSSRRRPLCQCSNQRMCST